MAITFGENQYGKAEVRLVHVTRDGDRHQIKDLNVSTALRGDFAAAHLEGDNSHVVATDTQKNTVYAFAQQYGVGEIEAFALRLGRHFTDSFEWVTGAKVSIEEYGWDRIVVDGAEHGHAFSRAGGGTRTTVVTIDGTQAWVVSGLTDLVVLKSTGSEFTGFPRDRYTTLAETTDRILATAVTARWRYASTDVDWAESYADVRRILLEAFAGQAQPGPAADPVLHGRAGAPGSPGGGRDPDVDAEQASLPGRPEPVRPAERQRGVLRRGPPVRADRGHGDPRRRARPGPGLAGRPRLLTAPGPAGRDPAGAGPWPGS